MFRKLLKYEWQANAKLFGILSAAALGVALLGGVVLRVALNIGIHSENVMVTTLVLPGMMLLVGFCALAVVGYAAAVEIINLVRFYKNKFTDEGYLTFTLPVQAKDLYLSSFVNILVWMLISLVVVLACYALGLWIGLGELVLELTDNYTIKMLMEALLETISGLRNEMATMPGYGLSQVLSVIVALLSPLYIITVMLGCLTAGSVLAKKHKILAAIGLYYATSMVTSIVTSTLSGVLSLTMIRVENLYVSANIVTTVELILMVGVIVGGYFLSTHFMKNKLNLP